MGNRSNHKATISFRVSGPFGDHCATSRTFWPVQKHIFLFLFKHYSTLLGNAQGSDMINQVDFQYINRRQCRQLLNLKTNNKNLIFENTDMRDFTCFQSNCFKSFLEVTFYKLTATSSKYSNNINCIATTHMISPNWFFHFIKTHKVMFLRYSLLDICSIFALFGPHGPKQSSVICIKPVLSCVSCLILQVFPTFGKCSSVWQYKSSPPSVNQIRYSAGLYFPCFST